jgi:uncharacterized protein (TIGR02596 family)
LLIVLAMVVLLSVLSVAGISALNSSRITTAALDIRAAAELARQKAMTSGSPVELRLYKSSDSTNHFSAFRIVSRIGTNEVKLKMHRLPDGILMINAPVASTMLSTAPTINDATPGFSAAETRVVRFLPDGSIEGLPTSAPQTLTVAKSAEPALANGLPANFATVSFDAVLGSTAIFRP